jgi:hypothetical protein
MRIALADLRLSRLYVVHPGRDSYPLDRAIEALSMRDLPARLAKPGRRSDR